MLAALGTFVFESRRGSGAPPAIEVRVDSVTRVGEMHHIALTIRNGGDAPAANVTVEGVLNDAEGTERSQVTVEYLAKRSERGAAMYFRGVPSDTSLSFRVLGYVTP